MKCNSFFLFPSFFTVSFILFMDIGLETSVPRLAFDDIQGLKSWPHPVIAR